jgi:hypothetical protein
MAMERLSVDHIARPNTIAIDDTAPVRTAIAPGVEPKVRKPKES